VHTLDFLLPSGQTMEFLVDKSICVGYSGRNQDMVKQHIEELAHEGIAPPPTVPMVYPVSDILVTQNPSIDVLGDKTSGEVEFVILSGPSGTYVTVGSDHTDRELEAYSIPYAKQATPKPVAKQVWPLTEVLDHWDELELVCEIEGENGWETYQRGSISAVLHPNDVLEFAKQNGALGPTGTILFCGTVPISGGSFRFEKHFRLALNDPQRERAIVHEYTVRNIAQRGGEQK
jgi:2-keto-4-pentenoate hydratase/2-oxohepta-3-ene-1,7-dioic acid hydratase in catechol pathway